MPIADLPRETIQPVSLNIRNRETSTGTGFEAVLAATLMDRQPIDFTAAAAPAFNGNASFSKADTLPIDQGNQQEPVMTKNADTSIADPSQAGATVTPASRNDTAVNSAPAKEAEPRHELNPLRPEQKKYQLPEEVTATTKPATDLKKTTVPGKAEIAAEKNEKPRDTEKVSDKETVVRVINDLAALIKAALDVAAPHEKEKPGTGRALTEKNPNRESAVLRQKIAEILEKMELMKKSSSGAETLQPAMKKLVAQAKELLERAGDLTTGAKGTATVKETIQGIMTRAEKSVETMHERADMIPAKTAAAPLRSNENAPANGIQTAAAAPFKGDTEGKSGEKNDSNQGMNFQLARNSGQLAGAAGKTVHNQSSPAAFAHQLDNALEKAKVLVIDNKNAAISVRLYPRELGSLHLSMGMEQGVITGRFTVETNQAKELLLQNLENVRIQLEDSGIAVGAFEVNVSDHHNGFHEENDIFPAKTLSLQAEAADEFEYNSVASHDGAINLVV